MIEKLNKQAVKIPPVVQLAEATGQKPGLILLVALFVLGLLVLIFMGGTILMCLMTVVYPAIQSIKALESKEGDDDKIWLTYWCVFGIFTLLDDWLGFLLAYIPFYFYIRLMIFLYLMLPQFGGARIVYEKLLRPLLIKHQSRIEQIIKDVSGGSAEMFKEGMKQAKDKLNDPNV